MLLEWVRYWVFVMLVLISSFTAKAEELTVAVASNFYAAAQKVATDFSAKTGIKVRLSSGASGVLYAQIIRGAPFDVFLSADALRPKELFQRGLAWSYGTYTQGQLALWVPQQSEPITSDFLRTYSDRLAVANPKLAPYGAATLQTLEVLQLKNVFKRRLIKGNNANQVFQFIESGNLSAGFVPKSLLILAQQQCNECSELTRYQRYWLVPESMHAPILQSYALIKHTEHADKFVKYLLSAPVQAYLTTIGYASIPQK
ncbi:molybdate ABC transporter substrate-binding protein [Pseudoalteromonas sp. S4741]|nr:molybdate ABC transporter substrate-binding protein [Pseudoalteromonas sp. S4741]